MQTLKEHIADAAARKKAVGHFNFSTVEVLWAIFEAAKDLGVPVVVGASEGERKFVGVKQASALVKSIREEYDYPIFLSADHTYSLEGAKEVVDAGYDMVIFDGARLSLAENIEMTKQAVLYARSANPGIIVEGELGYIGASSRLFDEIPADVATMSMTEPPQAREFVAKTGVDLLAPAVGNIHGMLKRGPNPRLDVNRIREIREAAGVPLVLHGGSGISDEDFSQAISMGMAIVHINTEIRAAWRGATQLFLEANPDEVAPYKILESAKREARGIAEKRLRLFNDL
ncbi:MAG: class II fructose-bisphosphate aldolase [Parcubacteria group bacterium]|nr:class II fructose-bisphosphate aldolase [Parcubacteria group bacterium]